MDRGWMDKPRFSAEYKAGLDQFLQFAFCDVTQGEKVLCPCGNCLMKRYNEVKEHLKCDGYLRGYTCWTRHGEDPPSLSASDSDDNLPNVYSARVDDMHGLVHAEGVKIVVKLDHFNAPISKSASVLGVYLGTIVKKPHLAPLNVLKWNDDVYQKIYHPKMIKEVGRKFAIDRRAKGWLLNQLDNKWRQYKGNLKKKFYKPNLPMERVLQTIPQTVDESQWASLVSYWYSHEAKEISSRNKENAKNIKHPHTLGRKSYARKRKELEDARGGEVDRATFFDECHKTKEGAYVNASTEEKMNEVYMKLAEKRLDCQELTEHDYEQAMIAVFGKDHSGRVRGMGPTVTPTNYYGGRFSNLSTSNEPGSSSNNINSFMNFVVSFLAEKYPEDDLMPRLPPFLRRQEVGENQASQSPHNNSPSTVRESPRPSSEE